MDCEWQVKLCDPSLRQPTCEHLRQKYHRDYIKCCTTQALLSGFPFCQSSKTPRLFWDCKLLINANMSKKHNPVKDVHITITKRCWNPVYLDFYTHTNWKSSLVCLCSMQHLSQADSISHFKQANVPNSLTATKAS